MKKKLWYSHPYSPGVNLNDRTDLLSRLLIVVRFEVYVGKDLAGTEYTAQFYRNDYSGEKLKKYICVPEMRKDLILGFIDAIFKTINQNSKPEKRIKDFFYWEYDSKIE